MTRLQIPRPPTARPRARLRFTAALALAAAVAAFAPMVHAEEPKTGGQIIYANVSGPGSLDPAMAASLVDLEIIHHTMEGLVAMDANYDTKPLLAESIDISPDGKTFTFKIRKGVKFHNGQELTSADVLATYERYAEISPNKGALANVTSYETPDPYTFIVHLSDVNAVFVDVLKTPVYPFVILPASQRNAPPREVEPIGSGPFKVGEWVKDSHIILEKNPDYSVDTRGDGPDGYVGQKIVYVDSVRYNFIPEPNSRVAAMQTGEAHITTSLPIELMKRLEGSDAVEAMSVFPYCQQYLIVHSQQPPTDNPKIRQAIRMSVDVDEMIAVTGGDARKNHSMVYPGGAYYGGDKTDGKYDENNPEGAKALLKEAGYNGEEILLQSNTNYDYMRDSILVLAEQLKAAGMNVKVDITDWTTNASNMQKGTGGWNVSTTGFCSNPLLGPQQWQTMIYNFPHVKDDKILDDAYAKFYTSLDLKDRIAAWYDIENDVLDNAYMIKVADRGSNRAISKKLHGFRPYNMNHFWGMWLDQ